MNNKTLFSQDKKFLELWKLYTKGIKEILHMRYVPHHWYILSDYCLFDKNKYAHLLPPRILEIIYPENNLKI